MVTIVATRRRTRSSSSASRTMRPPMLWVTTSTVASSGRPFAAATASISSRQAQRVRLERLGVVAGEHVGAAAPHEPEVEPHGEEVAGAAAQARHEHHRPMAVVGERLHARRGREQGEADQRQLGQVAPQIGVHGPVGRGRVLADPPAATPRPGRWPRRRPRWSHTVVMARPDAGANPPRAQASPAPRGAPIPLQIAGLRQC